MKRLSTFLVLYLAATSAFAGTITKPFTFSAGAQAVAAQVNACFDTIYAEFNGSISSANLAASSVGTTQLQAVSVTTAKIADANVTTAKLADAAVTTVKIADANVTTAKILDANVTTAKVLDGNITLAKIVNASAASRLMVRGSAAGAGVWQEGTLDGSTVEFNGTAIRVKAGGITSNELGTNSVTTVKVTDLNVTTAKLAANAVDDTKLSAFSVVPVGTVFDYAGSSTPSGWLLCDGSAVSRTTYSALFTAISTTYGVGDGSTTFNLPDLRGRAVFGKDNMGGVAQNRITNGGSSIVGTTLGATGGNELLAAHVHGLGATAGVQSGANFNVPQTSGAGSNTASTGGGSSANMPPAMIMNKIIKAGV